MGKRKVKIYPDNKENICSCFKLAGLVLEKEIQTDFAYIFAAVKKC